MTLASQAADNEGMEWQLKLAKLGAGIVAIALGALVALTIDTAAVQWRTESPILAGPLEMYRLGGVLGGIVIGGLFYNWLSERLSSFVGPSNPSGS